jgi:PAT family beta-lactamase induction signal transducer AmpG
MATAVFFENLCGGMGTAAFVALLMTLCNKSFSATQFALLSALSAVGRVYVGPIAGWFVEAHGWPTFYLFSVVAAVPGILLLLVCRQTLEYTQRTEALCRARNIRSLSLALRFWRWVADAGIWLLVLIQCPGFTSFSFLPFCWTLAPCCLSPGS